MFWLFAGVLLSRTASCLSRAFKVVWTLHTYVSQVHKSIIWKHSKIGKTLFTAMDISTPLLEKCAHRWSREPNAQNKLKTKATGITLCATLKTSFSSLFWTNCCHNDCWCASSSCRVCARAANAKGWLESKAPTEHAPRLYPDRTELKETKSSMRMPI